MCWCIERAVRSCQSQTVRAQAIIIVDDASTDDTEAVVRSLATNDARIKYFRKTTNEGHLLALSCGVHLATSEWVVLLDADDELTCSSVQSRLTAASDCLEDTGTLPQLVYGDLLSEPSGTTTTFKRLSGYIYPFVSKELCLCQTSTIMLGQEALSSFPASRNPYCTDDEIVLAISKHYHVLHCRQVVAIYHMHNSMTRMSNNRKKCFQGVYELVRDHQSEILQEHGMPCLLRWYLRILKALCDYQLGLANEVLSRTRCSLKDRLQHSLFRIYRKGLSATHAMLNTYLTKHFQLNYF